MVNGLDEAVFDEDSATIASQQTVPTGEIIISTLVGLNDTRQPIVKFEAFGHHDPVVASTTLSIGPEHVGRQAALLFLNGNMSTPVIVGFIHSPLHALLESYDNAELEPVFSEPSVMTNSLLEKTDSNSVSKTLVIDGKKVHIEGEEEIVLKCGDASITLTHTGKILIRGKYIVNRSSGVNRILGGSVQVN